MASAKNNIIKLVSCVLLILVADRLVGVFMTHAVNNARNGLLYEDKYKLIQAKPSVVIFGSSRANHHYNTGIIQNALGVKTINYGRDGSGIFFYYIALKTLLKYHVPQLVILDIKPGEFETANNAYQLGALYPLIDKLDVSTADLNAVSPYERVKLFFYTYRFNNQFFETLASARGPLEDTGLISGFSPLPVANNILVKRYITSAAVDTALPGYFNDIIQLCKSRKIRLVVCTSPIYGHYIYEASLAETDSICRRNGIVYLNYANNAFLTFNGDVFSDEAHLNSKGADIFTNDFVARIKP